MGLSPPDAVAFNVDSVESRQVGSAANTGEPIRIAQSIDILLLEGAGAAASVANAT